MNNPMQANLCMLHVDVAERATQGKDSIGQTERKKEQRREWDEGRGNVSSATGAEEDH